MYTINQRSLYNRTKQRIITATNFHLSIPCMCHQTSRFNLNRHSNQFTQRHTILYVSPNLTSRSEKLGNVETTYSPRSPLRRIILEKWRRLLRGKNNRNVYAEHATMRITLAIILGVFSIEVPAKPPRSVDLSSYLRFSAIMTDLQSK